MKIMREVNGSVLEFELDDYELLDAYLEKQHDYDKLRVSDLLYSTAQLPEAVLSLYATKCREMVEDDARFQDTVVNAWASALGDITGPGDRWMETKMQELHLKIHDHEPWTNDDYELYNYLCGKMMVKEALK